MEVWRDQVDDFRPLGARGRQRNLPGCPLAKCACTKYIVNDILHINTSMVPYTHIPIHSCSHTFMFPYTHVPIHSCSHTLMLPYTRVPIDSCSHTLVFP